MARWGWTWLIVLAGCSLLSLRAADPPAAPAETEGPYLGVQIAPVPEVLYAQLPALRSRGGVVITDVLPKSPAAEAGLRRHDILLAYDAKPIEDCAHFARLLRAARPDDKVELTLLREGREIQRPSTLGKGPLLTFAAAGTTGDKDPVDGPRGLAKPGAPARVSVTATPLGGGKMVVTIEFYKDGTGKLQTFTCSGTAVEIDGKVKELPQRVQDLARAALQRIRALDFPAEPTSRPGPPSNER
jgi:hypothetical protein